MKIYLPSFLMMCCLHVLKAQTYQSHMVDGDTVMITQNPFSQRTNIKYVINVNDTVTISVYNIYGALLISVRSNYAVSPNLYEDTIRLESYPPNYYFVEFRTKRGGKGTYEIQKIIQPVGIKELASPSAPRIYPNPVLDILKVDYENFSMQERVITINDVSGRAVYHLDKMNENSIDLSFLPAGIYQLQLQNGDNSSCYRFIKQ